MASLSAREMAYQTLRSRIITMELKPGDPLNDRELAEELDISRTPMREALLMLNLARMVDIKPQSGTHVAPINLRLMEMEQFARFTLEKEILNRLRGHVTPQQEAEYRRNIEDYRVLEADLTQPDRPTRLLELAHTIEEMKTICTCGRKAICNCRKVNGQFVFEGEQVAIDLENDVQYVSMCPQCYFKARRAFYAARKN